ncbi:MAG TPA: hypothetical protein VHB68_17990, partial [Steroidobacteraceae bacterium]|nr:hypothetical protein [Steroidobacteraceae bacterium]
MPTRFAGDFAREDRAVRAATRAGERLAAGLPLRAGAGDFFLRVVLALPCSLAVPRPLPVDGTFNGAFAGALDRALEEA